MIKEAAYKDDQLFMIPYVMGLVIKQLTHLLATTKLKKIVIFEGTCGDGRFINELIKSFPGAIILANDLDPDMASLRKGIMNYDFNAVAWDEYLLQIGIKSSEVIVCTGFPYGNCSALAIDCLNTVARYFFGAVVILPASINKTSNIDKVDSNLHMTKSVHLPNLSFQKPNSTKRISVGSIITTWLTKKELRPLYNSKAEHEDFSIIPIAEVEMGYDYDVVIQQKSDDVKIFDAIEGYTRSVYIKKTSERFENAGADYLFIKIHNKKTFTKTINKFKWPLLYKNTIGIGNLSQEDLVIAHEFINYGRHVEYIKLISNYA